MAEQQPATKTSIVKYPVNEPTTIKSGGENEIK